LHSQIELAVLVIEEFTTAVGRALEKVVVALVILYEIGLHEFVLCVIFGVVDETDDLEVGAHGFIIGADRNGHLVLEDIGAKLSTGIGLGVFVESEQFVLTENVQLDGDGSGAGDLLKEWSELEDVIVGGKGDQITVAE
jgi:hypothetical protein